MKELKSQKYWQTLPAEEWVRNRMFYSKNERRNPNQNELSQVFIPEEFEKIADNIETILEVGAGDGRLISLFAENYRDKKCASVDINPELSKYVAKTHGIKTFVGDVTKKLPFSDNQFDFVYTFQVLQHVKSREDIISALIELKRITKKELWITEGWGDIKKFGGANGHMRHNAGGGTYYWNIDELVECYETKFLMKEHNKGISNNKMYKIKL